ncbi:hypothetical protein NOVO_00710 [Rickettsiales bacterium Ac37b]|nr:hypothetical protein NOVO_00710 [Rickettsiales bacterium Ac37b]
MNIFSKVPSYSNSAIAISAPIAFIGLTALTSYWTYEQYTNEKQNHNYNVVEQFFDSLNYLTMPVAATVSASLTLVGCVKSYEYFTETHTD